MDISNDAEDQDEVEKNEGEDVDDEDAAPPGAPAKRFPTI